MIRYLNNNMELYLVLATVPTGIALGVLLYAVENVPSVKQFFNRPMLSSMKTVSNKIFG